MASTERLAPLHRRNAVRIPRLRRPCEHSRWALSLCLLFEYAATLGLIDVAFIPPAGSRGDHGDLWGTEDQPFFSRYDGLVFSRITALGTYCLGTAKNDQHAPVEVEVTPLFRVHANLEITALDADLERGDRLAFDAYAVRVSDLVWKLEAGKLLSATEHGRAVDETREFLSSRSGESLPDTVLRLLDDVAERYARAYDRGLARPIECDEEALAALIASDTRTRKGLARLGVWPGLGSWPGFGSQLQSSPGLGSQLQSSVSC